MREEATDSWRSSSTGQRLEAGHAWKIVVELAHGLVRLVQDS